MSETIRKPSPSREADLRLLVSILVAKLGGQVRVSDEEIAAYMDNPTIGWIDSPRGGMILEVENCTPQLREDHTTLTLTFIYLLEQLGGEVVVPHNALDWARYGTFSITPVEDGLRLAFKEREWAV